MLLIVLIIGIIGTIFLLVHVNLELNSLDNKFETLVREIKRHYGFE
jgi:hypothetical protein